MEKTNEIITIDGKLVRVMYTDELEGLCDGCVFCDPTEDGCTLNNTITAKKCYGMSTHGKYAYFVAAEDTEADTTAQARPVPSDVQEAEIRRINISPSEVRYVIDAIHSYAGIFMTEDDAKKGLAIFKAGMLAERERMMKEAPVAEVSEMREGNDPFMKYPFMLSLGFSKIPNIEYHGGKVRVIIEEIK